MDAWNTALGCAMVGDIVGFQLEIKRAQAADAIDALLSASVGGETCMDFAAECRHLDIVRICAENEAPHRLEHWAARLCVNAQHEAATEVVRVAARRNVAAPSPSRLAQALLATEPPIDLLAAVVDWLLVAGLPAFPARLAGHAAVVANDTVLRGLIALGCDVTTMSSVTVPWGTIAAPMICDVGQAESATPEGIGKCVQLLSASAGIRLEEAVTPLMIACARNMAHLARALLPLSDTHAVDEDGQNALMHCVHEDAVDAARVLAPVSNLSATTLQGDTALDLARRHNAVGVIAILEASELQADIGIAKGSSSGDRRL